MPRLILLNGPPGIGKSTLARLYADAHPFVLNLDIDQVRTLIWGWRDDFNEAGRLVRPMALGMVGSYLANGHDVIMPQYLGRVSEIEKFERAALEAGGELREIILTDTRERAIQRFSERGADSAHDWHGEVQEIVRGLGGDAALYEMYDHLEEVRRARPAASVMHSEAGEIAATYDALVAVLAPPDNVKG